MSNITYNNSHFQHQKLLFADKEFFRVFGVNLIEGDTVNALEQLNTVVITQSVSKKMFNGKSALGKVIKIDDDEYTISGVIKDFPETTHFHFDLLASVSTIQPETFGGLEFFTYYLMRKDFNFNDVSKKSPPLMIVRLIMLSDHQ